MSRFNAYLTRFFFWLIACVKQVKARLSGHREPATRPEPTRQAETDPERQQRPKRTRAKARRFGIRHLLENLDETFKVLRLPTSRGSWLNKGEVVGLRKLGVHVVHNPEGIWDTRLDSLPAGKALPAIACVGYGLSGADTDSVFDNEGNLKKDGRSHPAVFYSIKQSKIPPTVDPCDGQHFKFGLSFKVGQKSAHDKNVELAWVAGYATVRKDGTIHIHRVLDTRPVKIPRKRKHGGGMIYRRGWANPKISEIYTLGQDDGMRFCAQALANTLNWWMARDKRWSVGVKRDGERITFAVPMKETKHFFRDRIKAKCPSGATKRIIHYVREHDRMIDGGAATAHVKAHIRGIERFEWNGYDVAVTAQGFNGELTTGFTAATIEVDESDPQPERTIDISKAGAMLGRSEEPQRRAA